MERTEYFECAVCGRRVAAEDCEALRASGDSRELRPDQRVVVVAAAAAMKLRRASLPTSLPVGGIITPV